MFAVTKVGIGAAIMLACPTNIFGVGGARIYVLTTIYLDEQRSSNRRMACSVQKLE